MLLLACCAPKERVDIAEYVAPNLPAEEVATVSSGWGITIMGIDGSTVQGTFIRVSNFGGNKVIVTPGKHNFSIIRETSNGSYSSKVSFSFSASVIAGHKYEIGPEGILGSGIVMKDKTSNRVVMISPTTGDSPAEEGNSATQPSAK